MNTNFSDINLKDLLEYMGEKVIPHGKQRWKLKNHDSLILIDSLYVWNSKGIKGNFYSLLKEMYGYDKKESQNIVNKFIKDIRDGKYKICTEIYKNEKEENFYNIKSKNENVDKIIKYLVNKRKLNKKIVNSLCKKGDIYIDENNNLNFVIKDRNKAIKGCEVIGIGEKRYRRNTSSEYGFNLEKQGKELKIIYVFEAPIDLLSYIEMKKDRINEKYVEEGIIFLSVSGVREDILRSYIDDKIEKIHVCTDRDEAGDNFYNIVKEKYKGKEIIRELPKNKDWNEDLQKIKQKEKNIKIEKEYSKEM